MDGITHQYNDDHNDASMMMTMMKGDNDNGVAVPSLSSPLPLNVIQYTTPCTPTRSDGIMMTSTTPTLLPLPPSPTFVATATPTPTHANNLCDDSTLLLLSNHNHVESPSIPSLSSSSAPSSPIVPSHSSAHHIRSLTPPSMSSSMAPSTPPVAPTPTPVATIVGVSSSHHDALRVSSDQDQSSYMVASQSSSISIVTIDHRHHSGSMSNTRQTSSSFSSSPRGIIGGQRPLSTSVDSHHESNNSHHCAIRRLNGDILMHIMRFIDVISLARCVTLVNRGWYRLSYHDSLWCEFILIRWPELGQPPAAEPHPSSVDPFETVETRRKSRAASLSSHMMADAQSSLLSLLLQHYIRIDTHAHGSCTNGHRGHGNDGSHGAARSSISVATNGGRHVYALDDDDATTCWCCCSGINRHHHNNGNGSGTNNGIASATATPTRGSGNNVMQWRYRNARWWYGRWVTGRDIFGPSRIAYDYEFRGQSNMIPLDKGRHFIIEGRLTFEQQSCAIISLTTGQVHTTIPIQCLPTPLVRPELRWEPYVAPHDAWSLAQRDTVRRLSMYVKLPCAIGILISTLLASLYADMVPLGTRPCTLILLPIMFIIGICLPYIGIQRNQSRTVDELIFTLIAAAIMLMQVIVLALRLDHIISLTYIQTGLPTFIMFGVAILIGCWHGIDATRLHTSSDPHGCRLTCHNIGYCMRYVLAYIAVFGPFAGFCYMTALVADDTLHISWFGVMAPLFPYELVVLLQAINKCDNATYQLYRAHDLTRYVKQVDLRWLFWTRFRWFMVPILVVIAQVLLPLRLDGIVTWSYTATCIPIMLCAMITAIGEYWQWYGNRSKLLFVREQLVNHFSGEPSLPPSNIIALGCCS